MAHVATDWFDALGHEVSQHSCAACCDLLVNEGYDVTEVLVTLSVVVREIRHDNPAAAVRYMESLVGRSNQTLVIRTLATLAAPTSATVVDDLRDLLGELA